MVKNSYSNKQRERRNEQNIFGAILIFVAIYYLIKGLGDLFTSGVLLILGFGVSKDARSLILFCAKWIFSKITKKESPTYDFGSAKIVQHSSRDSIVNYGTMHVHQN